MMTRVAFCLLLLPLLLLTQTAAAQAYNPYDLPIHVANRIATQDSIATDDIRRRARNFRIVSEAEAFAAIDGETRDVPVILHESLQESVDMPGMPPVIASLVEPWTGAPFAACEAPCTLKASADRPSLLVLYRYGSELQYFPDHHRQGPHYMAFNEVVHDVSRRRCQGETAARLETVVNADAEPCVRVPPHMPPMAERSGHCDMRLTADARGETRDVIAVQCTEPIFCDASVLAVSRWIYHPKLSLGEAVERPGIETVMTYKLSDERGNLIPEPSGPKRACAGEV